MKWDRLPMILVLRIMRTHEYEVALGEPESDTFIWMRPAVRIQHQPTRAIASPFRFGTYAVWVYEQIVPDNQKANKQRVEYVLVPTGTRRGPTLLMLYSNNKRVAGHWAPGSKQLVLNQFKNYKPDAQENFWIYVMPPISSPEHRGCRRARNLTTCWMK